MGVLRRRQLYWLGGESLSLSTWQQCIVTFPILGASNYAEHLHMGKILPKNKNTQRHTVWRSLLSSHVWVRGWKQRKKGIAPQIIQQKKQRHSHCSCCIRYCPHLCIFLLCCQDNKRCYQRIIWWKLSWIWRRLE